MKTPSRLSPAQRRFTAELNRMLAALDHEGCRRHLTTCEATAGALAHVGGRWVVNWCSNDYLGLASHPAVCGAAADAAHRWGVGATASRLLSGTTTWHVRLEASLAAWFQVEAALVYSSGYLANLGTLSALLSQQDAVCIDRLAHASLVDAARSTHAMLRVFHHNDPEHLASVLARLSDRGRCVVVTEGMFSMDGDYAPLSELAAVVERYDALLYVDDAHGAFVAGATGRGSPERAGLSHHRVLYMGTLGKALGCQGGFVAGSNALIQALRNRARTFMYSTALAIPLVAAAVAALQILADDQTARRLLEQRVKEMEERAGTLSIHGVKVLSGSHIVPVLLGDVSRTMRVSARLWKRGLWAPAIRPPTVPAGTSRLRISLTARHTSEHLAALMETLRDALHSSEA